MKPPRRQRLARTDDDAPSGRIEMDDIERLAEGDADAAALADGEVDDAVVAAEHAAVDVDDVAGLGGARLELADHVGIAAARHEADVLAVRLLGDREPELARRGARLGLGHRPEREAEIGELGGRRREQEIALVAVEIGRPVKRAAGAAPLGAHIVAGRERVGAEPPGGVEEIGELDRLVAGDAGHRGLAGGVALGETVDHRRA